MKIKLLLFLFILLPCVISPFHSSYAEESTILPESPSEEIICQIESINYDISVIQIRNYTDESMTGYQEDEIYVPDGAVIEKDGEHIKLENLFAGDNLRVECRLDADGRKVAYHILVEE
jgi:hypothetical protein